MSCSDKIKSLAILSFRHNVLVRNYDASENISKV